VQKDQRQKKVQVNRRTQNKSTSQTKPLRRGLPNNETFSSVSQICKKNDAGKWGQSPLLGASPSTRKLNANLARIDLQVINEQGDDGSIVGSTIDEVDARNVHRHSSQFMVQLSDVAAKNNSTAEDRRGRFNREHFKQ